MSAPTATDGRAGSAPPGPDGDPGQETPLLLVLTGLHDLDALWFVQQARAAGTRCTVLTTEELSFALRRSHRVSDCAVVTEVDLADGTSVRSDAVGGVLNRSVEAPAVAWRHAPAAERGYATAELHAFMLSWLTALPCPVRNRPTPECLAGPVPNPLRVVAAALSSGLRCPDVRVGAARTPAPNALPLAAWRSAGAAARPQQLVVLDGGVVGGDAPTDVREGVTRLTASLGVDDALVGLEFLVSGDAWWFAGLSPLPELRSAGPTLVPRLLEVLVPESVRA